MNTTAAYNYFFAAGLIISFGSWLFYYKFFQFKEIKKGNIKVILRKSEEALANLVKLNETNN